MIIAYIFKFRNSINRLKHLFLWADFNLYFFCHFDIFLWHIHTQSHAHAYYSIDFEENLHNGLQFREY